MAQENQPQYRWGMALERVIPEIPLEERPLFLQEIEAKARREGNLEYLREIRAYKASLR